VSAGLGWEDQRVPMLMQAPGTSIFTPLSFCTCLTEGCGQQDRVPSAQLPTSVTLQHMGVSMSEEEEPIVLGQACEPRIR